jgi:hypothetical protein
MMMVMTEESSAWSFTRTGTVSAKAANHMSTLYEANFPMDDDELAELEELPAAQRRKPTVVCNITNDGNGDTDTSALDEHGVLYVDSRLVCHAPLALFIRLIMGLW